MKKIDGDLRKIFPRHLPHAQWTPVETAGTVDGVPDHEYCFPAGVQGWIEYKLARGHRVAIRPLQVAWLGRRSRLGGRCFIAIRQKKKTQDTLLIYEGRHATMLASQRFLDVPHLFSTCGTTSQNWDWEGVERVLLGGISAAGSP